MSVTYTRTRTHSTGSTFELPSVLKTEWNRLVAAGTVVRTVEWVSEDTETGTATTNVTEVWTTDENRNNWKAFVASNQSAFDTFLSDNNIINGSWTKVE